MGGEVVFDLPLADVNQNAVNLETVYVPQGASLDCGTGTFSWTPSQAGVYPLVVKVSKGTDTLGYLIRTITVKDNRPMFKVFLQEEECGDRSFEVREGESCSLRVQAFDPADGTALPCEMKSEPSADLMRYDAGDGSFAWTPAEGQRGKYTVTFSAESRDGISGNCVLEFHVIGRYETEDCLYPEADAYINTLYPLRNAGIAPTIRMRGGYRWGYLRFDLEELKGINGFVTDVSLRLTTAADSTDPSDRPSKVTTAAILLDDDEWEEGTLNNKDVAPGSNAICAQNWPAYEKEIKYYEAMRFGEKYDTQRVSVTEDVLSEYAKDGRISFCLRNIISKENAEFFARESEDQDYWPALVINKQADYDLISAQSARAGEKLEVTVPRQKKDGTPVTIVMTEQPETAVYDSETGVWTWTPDLSSAGEYRICYRAFYQEGGKTVNGFFTFTVTVEGRTDGWFIVGAPDYCELQETEILDMTFQISPIAITAPARAVSRGVSAQMLSGQATAAEIQAAIDSVSGAGGGVVTLEAGTYTLESPIELKSNVALQGAGIGETILVRGESLDLKDGLLYSHGGLKNVIVEKLTLDADYRPDDRNQENSCYGVWIQDDIGGINERIRFEQVEIMNAGMGFQTKGTYDLTVKDSVFHDNGIGSEKFFHNVYIRRTYRALIENCVMYGAESANGVNASFCEDIEFRGCEAYNNHFRGFRVAESKNIRFVDCVSHDNGNGQALDGSDMAGDGILLNWDSTGAVNGFSVENCTVYGNGGYGIQARASANGYLIGNVDKGGNQAGEVEIYGCSNIVQMQSAPDIKWSVTGLPGAAVMNAAESRLYWETTYQDAGRYTAAVRAEAGDTVTGRDIVILVGDVTTPVFEQVDVQEATVNRRFILEIGASDPENGELRFSAEGMPYGMSIEEIGGNRIRLSWTPQEYQKGKWNIALTAQGKSSSKIMFAINVREGEQKDFDRSYAEELLRSVSVGYQNGDCSHYAHWQLELAVKEAATEEELAEAVRLFLAGIHTDKTGDLDGDGQRTIADLRLLLEGYRLQDTALDINGDGRIELEDVVYLAKNVNAEGDTEANDSAIRTITIAADCGAYTKEDSPYQSWHVEKTLQTSDGAYIGFDISERVLPGKVMEAWLVLHAEDAAASGNVTVSVMKETAASHMEAPIHGMIFMEGRPKWWILQQS